MNLYLISDGSYADNISEHVWQTVIVVTDAMDEIVRQAAEALADQLGLELDEIVVNKLSQPLSFA